MITDNIILQILVYFLCIALIHYLYTFFRDTLTTPKIKDLIDKPKMDYKQFYDSFNRNNNNNNESNDTGNNSENSDVMKQELKTFFKSLNTNSVESSNIDGTSQLLHDKSVKNYTYNEELQYSSF